MSVMNRTIPPLASIMKLSFISPVVRGNDQLLVEFGYPLHSGEDFLVLATRGYVRHEQDSSHLAEVMENIMAKDSEVRSVRVSHKELQISFSSRANVSVLNSKIIAAVFKAGYLPVVMREC